MSKERKVLLELNNVGFTYSTGIGFYGGKKIEALRDISLRIHEGETLGLIGRNGCGKSTLLRLIMGIFKPGSGTVNRYCNRISLLALHVGFDQQLSGTDNLIISCMFLGASRREAFAMHDEIVEFAELEEYIGQPLKAYSTGMRARLGFSIGLKMKADLLLVDEVLSVGDRSFRVKAQQAMRERISSEQAVIYVSHDDASVARLCQRVIWLEDGEIMEEGKPEKSWMNIMTLFSRTGVWAGRALAGFLSECDRGPA